MKPSEQLMMNILKRELTTEQIVWVALAADYVRTHGAQMWLGNEGASKLGEAFRPPLPEKEQS